jgi:hypothetical protein
LLKDFSSLKAALLTNTLSNQVLAGDQFTAKRKNELRQPETRVPVDAVTA